MDWGYQCDASPPVVTQHVRDALAVVGYPVDGDESAEWTLIGTFRSSILELVLFPRASTQLVRVAPDPTGSRIEWRESLSLPHAVVVLILLAASFVSSVYLGGCMKHPPRVDQMWHMLVACLCILVTSRAVGFSDARLRDLAEIVLADRLLDRKTGAGLSRTRLPRFPLGPTLGLVHSGLVVMGGLVLHGHWVPLLLAIGLGWPIFHRFLKSRETPGWSLRFAISEPAEWVFVGIGCHLFGTAFLTTCWYADALNLPGWHERALGARTMAIYIAGIFWFDGLIKVLTGFSKAVIVARLQDAGINCDKGDALGRQVASGHGYLRSAQERFLPHFLFGTMFIWCVLLFLWSPFLIAALFPTTRSPLIWSVLISAASEPGRYSLGYLAAYVLGVVSMVAISAWLVASVGNYFIDKARLTWTIARMTHANSSNAKRPLETICGLLSMRPPRLRAGLPGDCYAIALHPLDFRGCLVLDPTLSDPQVLSREQLAALLAHECAHIRSCDHVRFECARLFGRVFLMGDATITALGDSLSAEVRANRIVVDACGIDKATLALAQHHCGLIAPLKNLQHSGLPATHRRRWRSLLNTVGRIRIISGCLAWWRLYAGGPTFGYWHPR